MITHTDFDFFFNDTATTEIYTLSLHDALPISTFLAIRQQWLARDRDPQRCFRAFLNNNWFGDRKSTRLNSSHSQISYAVFCLKKKRQRRDREQANIDGPVGQTTLQRTDRHPCQ